MLAYPIVGRLSDIHDRRVFLLLGLTIFSAGSVLLGFSESMTRVVAFRGVQGGGVIVSRRPASSCPAASSCAGQA